jgi:D-alanyl-D-alanine endopeptidase (penicillin-binding protein 7)
LSVRVTAPSGLFSLLACLLCLSGASDAAERAPPLEPLVPGRMDAPPKAGSPRPIAARTPPESAPADLNASRLELRSSSLLVLTENRANVLVARNAEAVRPIASITKLMAAMVVLDGRLPMQQAVRIGDADIDRLKGTHSRLAVGTALPRLEMLRLALMASENRAASSLANSYPGGVKAFVAAMNAKARALGMTRTRFVDATGLSQHNVSTASDLARMVQAAYRYPQIREFTTTARHLVRTRKGAAPLEFRNSNRLVQTGNREWRIAISKTGYTAEAGRCLVMHAKIGRQPVILVLLNSWGKLTPVGDANRIRRWMESLHG